MPIDSISIAQKSILRRSTIVPPVSSETVVAVAVVVVVVAVVGTIGEVRTTGEALFLHKAVRLE